MKINAPQNMTKNVTLFMKQNMRKNAIQSIERNVGLITKQNIEQNTRMNVTQNKSKSVIQFMKINAIPCKYSQRDTAIQI